MMTSYISAGCSGNRKASLPLNTGKEGLVMNDRIITHQPANKIPNIKLRHLYRFNCCLCL